MTISDFPPTRWSLIARLGDTPASAGDIIGRYAEAVATYLRARLHDMPAERRDDVVQDVLLELLQRPDVLTRAQPGPGSRFRYYLMTVAWHAACNALRRQRRNEHQGLAHDIATHDDTALHGAMDHAWAQTLLHHSLLDLDHWSADGTLDPHASTILRQHLSAGRSLRDIGVELGLSAATCCRRLARARTALSHALAARLRDAGELSEHDDPALAGDLILAQLATTAAPRVP